MTMAAGRLIRSVAFRQDSGVAEASGGR